VWSEWEWRWAEPFAEPFSEDMLLSLRLRRLFCLHDVCRWLKSGGCCEGGMYIESLNNGKVVVECCNARLRWFECDLSATLDAVTAPDMYRIS
jgi:hypothetical protein